MCANPKKGNKEEKNNDISAFVSWFVYYENFYDPIMKRSGPNKFYESIKQLGSSIEWTVKLTKHAWRAGASHALSNGIAAVDWMIDVLCIKLQKPLGMEIKWICMNYPDLQLLPSNWGTGKPRAVLIDLCACKYAKSILAFISSQLGPEIPKINK